MPGSVFHETVSVTAMSGGRLTVEVFSSGELVPPFAVEDAVQQGTAEIGRSTSYYAAGKNPALHFFATVPFGMIATERTAWLRYGGGRHLWGESCDAFPEPAKEYAELMQ